MRDRAAPGGWGEFLSLRFSPEAADRPTDGQTLGEPVASCLVLACSFIRLRWLGSSQDLPARGGGGGKKWFGGEHAAGGKKKTKTHFPACADLRLKAPDEALQELNERRGAAAAARHLHEVQQVLDTLEGAERDPLLQENPNPVHSAAVRGAWNCRIPKQTTWEREPALTSDRGQLLEGPGDLPGSGSDEPFPLFPRFRAVSNRFIRQHRRRLRSCLLIDVFAKCF